MTNWFVVFILRFLLGMLFMWLGFKLYHKCIIVIDTVYPGGDKEAR